MPNGVNAPRERMPLVNALQGTRAPHEGQFGGVWNPPSGWEPATSHPASYGFSPEEVAEFNQWWKNVVTPYLRQGYHLGSGGGRGREGISVFAVGPEGNMIPLPSAPIMTNVTLLQHAYMNNGLTGTSFQPISYEDWRAYMSINKDKYTQAPATLPGAPTTAPIAPTAPVATPVSPTAPSPLQGALQQPTVPGTSLPLPGANLPLSELAMQRPIQRPAPMTSVALPAMQFGRRSAYGAEGYQPEVGAYALKRRSPIEEALRRVRGGM